MSEDVSKIAASLTKAGKAAVLNMRADGGFSTAKEIGVGSRAIQNLWDRWDGDYGISNMQPLVDRDVCDMPLCYLWALNDLGLAVRAHLLENVK